MSISVKFESPKFKEKFLICSIKEKKKKVQMNILKKNDF